MLRASVLLLMLVWQIDASHFRNSSAVKAGKDAPVASISKKDKEDAEAVGGLVKGLNALANGATGEAGAAMRRKYMTRSQALVTNSTNVKTTGQSKKTKEDKENDEAIAGLVNGLNKLPMQNGKASPVAARMANLKNTALVSHAAPTAEVASKDANRIQRAQHALDKAEEATKSVDQEAAEARKDAESTKEALKTTKAAAALVSSKTTPAQKADAASAGGEQMPTKPQTPKTQKEDKEEKEAVSSFVNGLSKIPMRNGKISPVGVRMATRKKSALVSHAATPVPKPAATSAKSEEKPQKPQTPKTQKEDKDEKEAVSSFVNGLSKIPMRNGKVSPIGVRMATAAQRKKSALVSHAAPSAQKAAAPVDARDAEQNQRIQHALELADEEEKSVAQEEKEAHQEAEEARKLVRGPSK